MNPIFFIHVVYTSAIIICSYWLIKTMQRVDLLKDSFVEFPDLFNDVKDFIKGNEHHLMKKSFETEEALKKIAKQLKKLEDEYEVTRRRLDLHEEQVRKLQPRIYRDMKKAPARTAKNITIS